MSIEIKVGQIWRERDSRVCRKVQVIGFCDETGKVKIQKTARGQMLGSITRAKKERFGKSGGYDLVRDVSS